MLNISGISCDKYTVEQFLKRLISLCTAYLLLTLFISAQADAKRFPSDVRGEVQEQILKLESVIGIDVQRGIITKPYSDHMVDTLLQAIGSQYADVKVRALTLFAEIIKQLEVPEVTIDQNIKPAIHLLIKGHISSVDKADVVLVKLSKRVLWQMELKGISDGKERLEFLQNNNIENTTDDYYYSFEAMNYLVKMGSDEVRKVFEEKLKDSTERSMPKDIINNLITSLEKIDVIQDLENLDTPKKAKHLSDLISSRKEVQRTFEREFLIWLLRCLGKIDTLAAVHTLKNVLQDNTYDDGYRYEAQEILIQLKKLNLKDRIILFDF